MFIPSKTMVALGMASEYLDYTPNITSNAFTGRFKQFGLRGATSTFTEGVFNAFGFSKTAAGSYKFLGGQAIGATTKKIAARSLGIGAATFAVTGSPALATLGGTFGLGQLMGPAFVAHGMYEGWKEGGIGGAIMGGVKEAAIWGGIHLGFKAVGIAFKNTAVAGLASAAKVMAWPLVDLAVAGYAAYKGSQKLAEIGRKSRGNEFVGGMESFSTQAAYTMRQRAAQEISRSHTNARTILGNEAQMFHM